MSLSLLDSLLAHDRWATDKMLNACAALSEAQLNHVFEIGLGSVRATLAHMQKVVHGWVTSIEPIAGINFDEPATLATLRTWHERLSGELDRFAHKLPDDAIVTASRPPRTITAPRSAIVAHLLTHSMHHRAQVLNMLRHLGITPLPQSSVLEWMLTTGSATLTTSSTI